MKQYKPHLRARGLTAFITSLSVVVAGAGCASTDSNGQPDTAPVDLAVLKTGGLDKEPTSFTPKFHFTEDFRLIESRRMLNYLVHPFDVDPDLTDAAVVKLVSNADNMVSDDGLPEIYKPVGEKYQVLAGAYVSRTNGSLRRAKKLIISVLRFPTEDAGRRAAEEFDNITNSDPGRHPIAIDGHPDARASSADDLKAVSFISHGPYVILTNTGLPTPDPAILAGNTKKAIELQIAKLDQQQSTPLDDILDLPQDPDGIMRRAAPTAKDYSDPLTIGYSADAEFGPYHPDGALHFMRDPIAVRKAFDEAGVDLIGRRVGVVYRTRDVAAALRLQKALSKTAKNDEAIDPPPGLTGTRCVQYDYKDPNRRYNAQCALVYNRYVATVFFLIIGEGKGRQALYERAAAQYSILAKSE